MISRDPPEITPNLAKIRTQIRSWSGPIPGPIPGQDPDPSQNGQDPGIMDLRVVIRMAQIRGHPRPRILTDPEIQRDHQDETK